MIAALMPFSAPGISPATARALLLFLAFLLLLFARFLRHKRKHEGDRQLQPLEWILLLLMMVCIALAEWVVRSLYDPASAAVVLVCGGA